MGSKGVEWDFSPVKVEDDEMQAPAEQDDANNDNSMIIVTVGILRHLTSLKADNVVARVQTTLARASTSSRLR